MWALTLWGDPIPDEPPNMQAISLEKARRIYQRQLRKGGPIEGGPALEMGWANGARQWPGVASLAVSAAGLIVCSRQVFSETGPAVSEATTALIVTDPSLRGIPV